MKKRQPRADEVSSHLSELRQAVRSAEADDYSDAKQAMREAAYSLGLPPILFDGQSFPTAHEAAVHMARAVWDYMEGRRSVPPDVMDFESRIDAEYREAQRLHPDW